MAEVILLEKISSLGAIGQQVKVSDGFARNYLIPQKRALLATEANKQIFEKRRHELEVMNQSKLEQATANLSKVDKIIIKLVRQAGEDGRLYGSVTTKDIAKAIEDATEFSIHSEQIILTSRIKEIGSCEVSVVLHPDVVAKLTLEVKRHDS